MNSRIRNWFFIIEKLKALSPRHSTGWRIKNKLTYFKSKFELSRHVIASEAWQSIFPLRECFTLEINGLPRRFAPRNDATSYTKLKIY